MLRSMMCLSRSAGPRFCSAASCHHQRRSAHTLPDLPYSYDALEPVISRDIMELHHKKHHQTYVNNFNAAVEKYAAAIENNDPVAMISLEAAIRFNGGGHINHSIFWNNLSPKGGALPKGDLMDAIVRDFGSFDRFKQVLTDKTVAIQGSGWGWLGYNPLTRRLRMAFMPNQDPLYPVKGLVPLLGIDVWEHAYYLQYKNVRPDYVNAIWNVINWVDVEERYADACMNY